MRSRTVTVRLEDCNRAVAHLIDAVADLNDAVADLIDEVADLIDDSAPGAVNSGMADGRICRRNVHSPLSFHEVSGSDVRERPEAPRHPRVRAGRTRSGTLLIAPSTARAAFTWLMLPVSTSTASVMSA